MLKKFSYRLTGFLVVLGLHYVAVSMQAQSPAKTLHEPRYTSDGRMEFPADYREWIFLARAPWR